MPARKPAFPHCQSPVFEAVGRHFGVPDRALNVLVAEVMLQSPRVVAVVGEPATCLKVCAMLEPKELKLEPSGGVAA
jgi:hypothetical protein